MTTTRSTIPPRTGQQRPRRRELADASVTATTPGTGPIPDAARNYRAQHGDYRTWTTDEWQVFLDLCGAR